MLNDVSNHFEDRFKQRMNIPKKSLDRFLSKALSEGYSIYNTYDSKLKKKLTEFCREKTRYAMFYKNKIIILTKENIAITVMDAPQCIKKAYDLYRRTYYGNSNSEDVSRQAACS